MQKDKIFDFKDVVPKMAPIEEYLSIANAIKLEFDANKVSTKENTHLTKVKGKDLSEITVPDNHNVYFIFDKDFKCRYVGKKGDKEGINYRLKLHLVSNMTEKNKSPTWSCIKKVCSYLNKESKILYLITISVEPSFMAEGVESYFIDHFREIKEADWVERK